MNQLNKLINQTNYESIKQIMNQLNYECNLLNSVEICGVVIIKILSSQNEQLLLVTMWP